MQRDTPSYRLPRKERLRGRNAIASLFESGNSGFTYPIRYVWREVAEGLSEGSSEGSIEGIDEGTSEGTIEGTSGLADGGVCEEVMIESGSHSTLLFTVPKRFHKRANKRNLLRRRVKEAYRLNKSILEGLSLHIALVYSTKEALDYAHISKSVVRILHQIREEANR